MTLRTSRRTRSPSTTPPTAPRPLAPASHVTVGLDVGDRHSVLCVLDDHGDVVEEGRVPTTPAALERRFRAMSPARVVLAPTLFTYGFGRSSPPGDSVVAAGGGLGSASSCA